jgi:hypothetical protein
MFIVKCFFHHPNHLSFPADIKKNQYYKHNEAATTKTHPSPLDNYF